MNRDDSPTQTTPSNSLKPPLIVACVLIIAVVAGTGGYSLGKRDSRSSWLTTQKERPTAGPQALTPTPSPDIKPVVTGQLTFAPLKYRFFVGDFIQGVNYPKEMTSLSQASLTDTACGEESRFDSDGDKGLNLPPKIRDEMLKKEAWTAFTCDAGAFYIVVYQIGDNRGGESPAFIAVAQKAPFQFTDVAIIPVDEAYFGCQTVLALTRDNVLYIQCGGGDVSYSKSIYRIDIANVAMIRIINCRGSPLGNGRYSDICTDAKGQEVYSATGTFPK